MVELFVAFGTVVIAVLIIASVVYSEAANHG